MVEMVRNTPTPEGRLVGEQLARLTEKAFAKLKSVKPPFQPPCTTCAFRRGSFPNGCIETVMDALKCVMEGRPFMCHETKDCEGLCKGWYASQAVLTGLRKLPTPWPYSYENDDDSAAQKPTKVSQ